ncbi:KAP-like P-loop domain-containing protein [Vibrio crassostreae]|uniref:KAP family P-loop NTPase fold protein n=1 Tax=Vibrio crassostreae TaxID=246167 RepID=UPI001052564C|nr:P-loop NTPase fold protein [Vibrio crassostreae]TCN70972.1 KAP-like P-loop domain-containing protein [Vibrio crassostreae]
MSNIHFVSPDERFEKYEIINNQPYAEHLTQFLKSKAENGYVLNLNAEWGAGKTTFLQCWYNELKENHPVVYFDAWKSDFTKDPMLALMDAFHQQLISPLNKNKELIEKFFSKGSHFVKTALPSLLVGYLKNQGGMDGEDSLLTSASDTFGISENDLSDALKDTMKAMLSQKNRVEGIEEFKEVLVQLSEDYIECHPNQSSPVFVLIDELDRCRPTYAIEVIECVKHFFNTKNFIFVLATDTNQLQHSIKSIYGAKFDSLIYLSRFFDNSATLPVPNRREHIEVTVAGYLHNTNLHPRVLNFIDAIFEWHGTRSLREIQKIIAVIDVASSQEKSYSAIVLIVISLLKKCYPEHYVLLKDNHVNPYKTKYGSPSPENIRGRYTSFELTNKNKQSTETLLYMAAKGNWGARGAGSLDSYRDVKDEGPLVDEAIEALFKESFIYPNHEAATMIEHFSLIEFAGFFQD